MSVKRHIAFSMGCLVSLILVPAASTAIDLGLTDLLMSQLSVTKPQAMGGSGAIFKYAKAKMTPANFGDVATAVPEMDGLLAAAPEREDPSPASAGGSALGGALGKAASVSGDDGGVGGMAAKAAGLAGLGGSFEKLGMQPDMVGKFVPVVVDYVKSAGGDGVGSLLSAALQ